MFYNGCFFSKYESDDNTKAKTDERLCRQAQFLFFFHEYSPSYAIPSLTVHTYVTTMLFHSTFYFKSACSKQPPLCYILSQISFPQMSSGREVSAVPGKFPNSPAKHAFRELFRMSCIPEMHLCHVLQLVCSCHRTV